MRYTMDRAHDFAVLLLTSLSGFRCKFENQFGMLVLSNYPPLSPNRKILVSSTYVNVSFPYTERCYFY